MKKNLAAMKWAMLCTALTASSLAFADAPADADALARKGDVAAAIKLLEAASDKGDIAAKARLASYLTNFGAPYGDVARGCRLGHEAADAGNAAGMIVRADCLARGAEPAEHPFDEARKLARAAHAGDPGGAALELYKIYLSDPKYSYRNNGSADKAKYDALAAMPVSARDEQIEALNGLAEAQALGNSQAQLPAFAYLVQTTAPKNAERVALLAQTLPQNGIRIPETFKEYVKAAETLKRVGNSNVSVQLFHDSYRSAFVAAAAQLAAHAGDLGACDVKTIELSGMKADPVDGAEYLSVNPKGFMRESYLLHGNWKERWSFVGCGKVETVEASFSADGWGGATYSFKALPPQ